MEQKKNNLSHNNSEKSVTFSLKGFKILRFNLVEPGLDITNNFELIKLKFGFNMNFSFSVEQNGFQIVLTLFYHYELNGKEIQLLELVLITDFLINNLAEFIIVDNENFSIPDELLANLVSIAYSSARGIIYAKTTGSFLNQFLLPLIDPRLIVQKKMNSNA